MASRNGFGAFGPIGFSVLLAAVVLSGCASGGPATGADAGPSEAVAANDLTGPQPLIAEIASTAGDGTKVAFPDTTPPTFADPVPGADRAKVYGSVFYRFSGDNNPIPTNIATLGEEGEAGHESTEAPKGDAPTEEGVAPQP